ncbi:hypothetical protein [Robertmurraya andreesenii]|uniref:Uncharacterized protein n=1 Tax=Anoxybacillus andreesenii TaxID=1325932 RepID=A0ABT9V420_9BACL|nr:hypothetical protein [Robertmurraya andreesenii]MDQ0155686.1 hypothetical protein [Robertmurraya andreesenii]
MIICEWKTFSTDTETHTQETFEEIVQDEFEAMMYKEHESIPSYIWTINYVIIVKRSSKILSEISFEKIPRNPVCE